MAVWLISDIYNKRYILAYLHTYINICQSYFVKNGVCRFHSHFYLNIISICTLLLRHCYCANPSTVYQLAVCQHQVVHTYMYAYVHRHIGIRLGMSSF